MNQIRAGGAAYQTYFSVLKKDSRGNFISLRNKNKRLEKADNLKSINLLDELDDWASAEVWSSLTELLKGDEPRI